MLICLARDERSGDETGSSEAQLLYVHRHSRASHLKILLKHSLPDYP